MEPSIPETTQHETAPATGQLRLFDLESSIFQNTRKLRIWSPPGYDDPENKDRHYPIFYLNDGQNLFDPATAFAGVDWQVDEAAIRLIGEGKIPPLILCGIDNTQKDRIREYIPYRTLNPRLMRPQGKRYPDFLLSEVMPLVNRHYRVARGPENTGFGGSSLGALISLYTVLDHPGVIGRLLLESPSLFISNRRLLKYSRAFRDWPGRIFLAIGTAETGNPDKDEPVVEDVRELEALLRRSGLGPDRLLVEIEQGGHHSEADWARRFPAALEFLFRTG